MFSNRSFSVATLSAAILLSAFPGMAKERQADDSHVRNSMSQIFLRKEVGLWDFDCSEQSILCTLSDSEPNKSDQSEPSDDSVLEEVARDVFLPKPKPANIKRKTLALNSMKLRNKAEMGAKKKRKNVQDAIFSGAHHMPVSKAAVAPFGHIVFCVNNPTQCSATNSQDNSRIELTKAKWAELKTVQREVNQRIKPRLDKGPDVWSLDVRFGDCEDYVLTKRAILIKKGWPSSSLLIATARLPSGINHAVLVVHTKDGDFVLDNLRTSVVAYNKLPYKWGSRQSASDPHRWVRIASESPIQLASASDEQKEVSSHNKRRAWAQKIADKRAKIEARRKLARIQLASLR